jgi:hypothetical protein
MCVLSFGNYNENGHTVSAFLELQNIKFILHFEIVLLSSCLFQDQEFQDHSQNAGGILNVHHNWLVSAHTVRIHALWLMYAHPINSAVFLTHSLSVLSCVSVLQIPLLTAMEVAKQLVSISQGTFNSSQAFFFCL